VGSSVTETYRGWLISVWFLFALGCGDKTDKIQTVTVSDKRPEVGATIMVGKKMYRLTSVPDIPARSQVRHGPPLGRPLWECLVDEIELKK
jgi:hypothetical protein